MNQGSARVILDRQHDHRDRALCGAGVPVGGHPRGRCAAPREP
ncbi:hypothetical protein WMF20_06980 [Sorangium sp. So ce834]